MDGGNVLFRAGCKGGPEKENGMPSIDGSFIFELADGTEFLRINPDNSIIIKGEKAPYAGDVYHAFKKWLEHATYVSEHGVTCIEGGVHEQG
jgi:hypothetical protein